MPEKQIYELRPLGWENDPDEERRPLSTLDYLTACTYNNYCLFFRVDDSAKPGIAATLKEGLERTIAQVRTYCGTIEKDPNGPGHSFVKRKDSAVAFHVQWLDSAADADKYPSLEDIEKAHFSATTLGDLEQWSVPPMTYGEKPASDLANAPLTAAAFKANFIRGGLMLHIHHHHYCNDLMGWVSFTRQLADNCRAVSDKTGRTPFPDWDPANLDRSVVTKAEPPEEEKVDGPPAPQRHPDHQVASSLLFHLPKSKAAALKQQCTPSAPPSDGGDATDKIPWVSTYDAFTAFIWRHLTRVRQPVFNPDPASHLYWIEGIDMRKRFSGLAPRIQGNIMCAADCNTAAVPPAEQPTVADVAERWPLGKLAQYIRRMTASATPAGLDATLGLVATVRDKSALNVRVNAQPPLSILMTDHRDADMAVATDFGWGKPVVWRHLFDNVTEGVICVLPPRADLPGDDQGNEFVIAYEKRLVGDLLRDEQWGEYFEFRGVDAEDAYGGKGPSAEKIPVAVNAGAA